MTKRKTITPPPPTPEEIALKYYRFTTEQHVASSLLWADKEFAESLLEFDKEYFQELTCFTYNELKDPLIFLSELKNNTNALSVYLVSKFDMETQKEFKKEYHEIPFSLISDILDDINELL